MNSVTPDLDESTIELGAQLGASVGLLLVMVLIHTFGLLLISNMLNLGSENLKEKDFNARSVGLLAAMGLLIFLLHILEIFVFAGFYMMVGAIETLEEALYFSASAYATLGTPADYFPQDWRLVGAIEALIGFILIGWSTAFMVKTINRLQD
ncbi:MAG: hypothetical protein H0W39_04975 [Sphingomonas sp.]|nr:hypothetical protein [Sphingomonas sp.]